MRRLLEASAGQWVIGANARAWAESAAERLTAAALGAVRDRSAFFLAISGGQTPCALFERLGAPPFRERFPWLATRWFWVDERWTPHDRPESNFGAAAPLLRAAGAPEHTLCPIPTDADGPEAGARAYETLLRRQVPTSDGRPAWDAVLLGMGADGHTASLFPGDEARFRSTRWVEAVTEPVGRPRLPRITLTPLALGGARLTALLVRGHDKREPLRRALCDQRPEISPLPVARALAQAAHPALWADRDAIDPDLEPDP